MLERLRDILSKRMGLTRQAETHRVVPMPYALVIGERVIDGIPYQRVFLCRFNVWRGVVVN